MFSHRTQMDTVRSARSRPYQRKARLEGRRERYLHPCPEASLHHVHTIDKQRPAAVKRTGSPMGDTRTQRCEYPKAPLYTGTKRVGSEHEHIPCILQMIIHPLNPITLIHSASPGVILHWNSFINTFMRNHLTLWLPFLPYYSYLHFFSSCPSILSVLFWCPVLLICFFSR